MFSDYNDPTYGEELNISVDFEDDFPLDGLNDAKEAHVAVGIVDPGLESDVESKSPLALQLASVCLELDALKKAFEEEKSVNRQYKVEVDSLVHALEGANAHLRARSEADRKAKHDSVMAMLPFGAPDSDDCLTPNSIAHKYM